MNFKLDSNYEVVIKVQNLVKVYNGFKALNGVSFEVRKGEIYGLLGPNGAGKTTTLRIILGLLEPTEGLVKVFNFSPLKDPVKVKSLVGYVPEDVLLLETLTPKEFFEFVASIRRLNLDIANKRLNQLASAFEIKDYFNVPIASLSSGTKQKIAVISALLHDPPLLIFDEPMIGLDAKSSRILKDLMRMHVERGGTILFSTHILEVAEKLCTRIGIISKGRVIAEGTVEELRKLIHETDASLEEILLRVIEEDKLVAETVKTLREAFREQ
ncbi:ABC transporter ATP-binding protein [Candidatus Bathyarchaeota archaeon]|nr:MAG: ABC transporter ATP-binding protein [Candidatus Bathyarchaeota archaeon]